MQILEELIMLKEQKEMVLELGKPNHMKTKAGTIVFMFSTKAKKSVSVVDG